MQVIKPLFTRLRVHLGYYNILQNQNANYATDKLYSNFYLSQSDAETGTAKQIISTERKKFYTTDRIAQKVTGIRNEINKEVITTPSLILGDTSSKSISLLSIFDSPNSISAQRKIGTLIAMPMIETYGR